MTNNRQLTWDGCNNVRDLGGLNISTGHKTRWGAVVRSDHPAKLTAEGWSALYAHGVRTVISLRTHGLVEDFPDTAPRPSDVESVVVEIEDVTDIEFAKKWASSDLWCTPLYYRDALNRWPQRHAAAIKTIAQAKAGGVLFHCKRGHDRTGIISLLLLALVGVSPDEIVADYELSVDPEREELLAGQNTTTREVILSTLASLDVENYFREGGLTQTDIDAIRARFLEINT
ncbi:MAG TPA: tyrosine-protein phosphatase [Anaerolineales bacterium]|nr:tyrosine-protein phosphatase [Anaerolineales bacterium]